MTIWKRWGSVCVAGAALSVTACDNEKSAESFSSLERCLLGAAPKSDAELAQRWRALELTLRKAPSETSAKDWPKRCEPYADQLYHSLGDAAESSMLRKELATQLGCSDEAGSCKFPEKGPVLSSPAALWQAVKITGIERKEAPGIEPPKAVEPELLGAADWPALAPKGWGLVDRHQTSDGKVWLLLRAPTGRDPVRLCELVGSAEPGSSFTEAKCRSPHADVPSMPLQSVMLVDRDDAPAIAGLTEEGRKAFDFGAGKPMQVRGLQGSEVAEGVAVERGENDEGYEAYVLAAGKQSKAIPLEVAAPLAGPMALGPFVVWAEKGEGTPEQLVVEKAAGRTRLKEVARLTGNWSQGELTACKTPGGWAVASWGRAKGSRGATATAGKDSSGVTVTFFDAEKNAWSQPVTGKIPFERDAESLPSCSEQGFALAWAEDSEGTPRAGRITCTPEGCKTAESSWPSLGVQAWAGVAPLADGQLVAVYRTVLGDLRARLGDAAALGTAKMKLLADDESHGGPVIAQPLVLSSPGAAVVLFKSENALHGLRIGADGSASPLPVR